jgi:hypothetical protein
MRRNFQFDGLDGKGILSVGKCVNQEQVALCISHGDQELQILLSREDFEELAGLRYTLKFTSDDSRLKAVQ